MERRVKNKRKAVRGHSDLYNLVMKMDHAIRTQKRRHPRTKIWKELLDMVDELREIQADWFDETRAGGGGRRE